MFLKVHRSGGRRRRKSKVAGCSALVVRTKDDRSEKNSDETFRTNSIPRPSEQQMQANPEGFGEGKYDTPDREPLKHLQETSRMCEGKVQPKLLESDHPRAVHRSFNTVPKGSCFQEQPKLNDRKSFQSATTVRTALLSSERNITPPGIHPLAKVASSSSSDGVRLISLRNLRPGSPSFSSAKGLSWARPALASLVLMFLPAGSS